jgi:hypothetical protein
MLRIGIITPSANEFPFLGKDFINSITLSLAGSGDNIRLFTRETERGIPVETVPLVRQLIVGDEVDVVIGFTDTKLASEISDLLDNTGVPCLLTDMGPRLPLAETETPANLFYNTFRIWESCLLTGMVASAKHGTHPGVLASFFDSGYPLVYAHHLGTSLLQPGEERFVAVTHKDPSGETFEDVTQMLQETQPDYIFGSYYGKQRNDFWQWLQRIGYPAARIFASPGIGPRSGRETYVTSWCPEVDSVENSSFIDLYREHNKRPVSEFAMLGYETGLIIGHCFGNEAVPDRELFGKRLETIGLSGPRGEIRFDSRTRSTYTDPYLVEFIEGEEAPRVTRLDYPLEKVRQEIANGQFINQIGWKNTYLCK